MATELKKKAEHTTGEEKKKKIDDIYKILNKMPQKSLLSNKCSFISDGIGGCINIYIL